MVMYETPRRVHSPHSLTLTLTLTLTVTLTLTLSGNWRPYHSDVCPRTHTTPRHATPRHDTVSMTRAVANAGWCTTQMLSTTCWSHPSTYACDETSRGEGEGMADEYPSLSQL